MSRDVRGWLRESTIYQVVKPFIKCSLVILELGQPPSLDVLPYCSLAVVVNKDRDTVFAFRDEVGVPLSNFEIVVVCRLAVGLDVDDLKARAIIPNKLVAAEQILGWNPTSTIDPKRMF